MTIVSSGEVTCRDVAAQLYNSSGADIQTDSDYVRRLVKQTGNITYPDTFYGKGWGMQMSLVGGWNGGDSSNMKPYLMDKRSDGGKGPPASSQYYLDNSKSWYGGVFMQNANSSSPAPRELAINGYYRIRNPQGSGCAAAAEYEVNWDYGPNGIRTSVYLFGFSDGYLSGNRATIQGVYKTGTSSGTMNAYGNYQSSYRHLVPNFALWADASSQGTARFWNGRGY